MISPSSAVFCSIHSVNVKEKKRISLSFCRTSEIRITREEGNKDQSEKRRTVYQKSASFT